MKPRWLLLLAIPLFALTVRGFLRMDEAESGAPAGGSELPRYTVHDATLTRFDANGQVSLVGTATTVEYFDDRSSSATEIDVDLMDRDGKTWNLKSPTARMPAEEKRIILDGDVLCSGAWPDTAEPLRIATSQVWIDPATHHFGSATSMNLSSAARNGSAIGFQSDWLRHQLNLQTTVRMSYAARS